MFLIVSLLQRITVFLIFFLNVEVLALNKKSQWIVITTINYPTKAIEKLAQFKDWQVVIVGDKKTPPSWALENCIYLSPDDQMNLNYNITRLFPWNNYSRKNICYLYAIENGAQVIYDTDDDNILINDRIDYLPVITKGLIYKTNESTVNPYAYFGQDSIWPRGYPLDKILAKAPFSIEEAIVNPYFQQGLVDLDPDVDAIFRLSRGIGSIVFDSSKQPICLPSGTLCPFNTQNTVIHSGAFWGLLIPITTKFRVCDIWRGYWAQRLLWDINGNICFMPSTVIQERNDHNLLHDFIDELDLYTKSGDLVNTLIDWKSTNSSFFGRIQELTDIMIQKDFYKKKERELVDAWLQDLKNIGYDEPKIVN